MQLVVHPILMASQYVIWILPWMLLEFEFVYGVIIGIGAVYALIKTRAFPEFFRDVIIIALVIYSAHYGLDSGHTVVGLLGVGLGTALALSFHSSQFAKTNDMAPFGHLTAISILNGLLVLSGLLTSELW